MKNQNNILTIYINIHKHIYTHTHAGIENDFREQEDRINRLRAEGVKSKGNKQSVPYDPLTLKYQESLEGLKLRNEDDFVRYRSKLRSIALQERASFITYDPITGEDKSNLAKPPRPVEWEQLKTAWEEEQLQLEKERRQLNAQMHYNA